MKKTSLFACALLVLAGLATPSAPVAAENNINLTGAGATFPYPLYSRWFSEYNRLHPNVRINYQPIGSGGGIQQVKNGTVDFGASDAALSDQQLATMPALVQLPMTAGPVCITYNLRGVSGQLKLTGSALAGIYIGSITKWNDGAIARANPGVNLPNRAILVVHRSDGSGTTNIFTTYLAAVDGAWAAKVGKGTAVNWPQGLGGKGNDGVAGLVKNADGAIGYVELAYALENKLPVALLQNQAGRFLPPTPEGITAAIAANAGALARDVRTPVVNSAAPDAYPIGGFTFLLVTKSGRNTANRAALKQYITWAVTAGQSFSGALHYATLPSSIVALDKRLLNEVR